MVSRVKGSYYRQSSELCGVLNGFMPCRVGPPERAALQRIFGIMTIDYSLLGKKRSTKEGGRLERFHGRKD